jgi:hypothetical protein
MNGSRGSRTFLVECFTGSALVGAVARSGDLLSTACAELRSIGIAIDYLGALLVPEDELVLYLILSGEDADVRDATQRAALPVERIVESVVICAPPDGALVVPRA